MRSKTSSSFKSPSFIEQARRGQLIGCAIESIACEGYAGASLAQVAQRAGVSKGVILYHFKSKDELVEKTLAEIFRELGDFIVPRLKAQSTARGQLLEYIRSQMLFLEQHRSHLLAVAYILSNHRNERGEFQLRSGAEHVALKAITDILKDGQSRGEFRSFALQPMAATLLNSINGALSQWVSDPDLSLTAYAKELESIFDLATRKAR